jgi:Flp pilus assembly protein TadD
MLADHHFRTATLLFYESNYEQALEAINRCLSLQRGSSMIYSNRALIHYHMGSFQLAQQDIAAALALNPLNYIVYFNAFSMLVK